MRLRRKLWSCGVRYRVGYRTPGGRADIVLPNERVAIFIDGCFWHGCPDHYVRPRGQSAFWEQKLLENVSRDRRQTRQLLDAGWKPIRLREHEIRDDLDAASSGLLRLVKAACARWPNWRVVRVEALDAALERRYLEKLIGPRRQIEESRRITTKVGRVLRTCISASGEQSGNQ